MNIINAQKAVQSTEQVMLKLLAGAGHQCWSGTSTHDNVVGHDDS